MKNILQVPDYLFECSWEVCNKVGGIYTVLSTKSHEQQAQITKNHFVIGPDFYTGDEAHSDFIPDENLYEEWVKHALKYNLKVKVGHWDVPGKPVAILVDFKPFYEEKNTVFTKFWELYGLDSISGHDDYLESAMFGYACGKTIESFYKYYLSSKDSVIAHFHEWMTGAGVLHLRDAEPQISTAFTTHATVTGRSIAGKHMGLYDNLTQFNADAIAQEHMVKAKHSIEQKAAVFADCFTTVSDITAAECASIVGKPVDVVTPNGFEDKFVPKGAAYTKKRKAARKVLSTVTEALTGRKTNEDTVFIASSGRYEFYNKGLDVFIDSLKTHQGNGSSKNIVAFILTPAHQSGPRADLQQELENAKIGKPCDGLPEANHTHGIWGKEHDPILQRLSHYNPLANGNSVDIIFVPAYLDGNDGIFNLYYYDLLVGFDLTVFPSYYEPWGYTPLESVAFSIPTVTTTLAGFGKWIEEKVKNITDGAVVLNRNDHNYHELVHELAGVIDDFCNSSDADLKKGKKNALAISKLAKWKKLIEDYKTAYDIGLKNKQQRLNN